MFDFLNRDYPIVSTAANHSFLHQDVTGFTASHPSTLRLSTIRFPQWLDGPIAAGDAAFRRVEFSHSPNQASTQYSTEFSTLRLNAVFSDRTVQDVANTLIRCVVLPSIRRTRGNCQASSHPREI
jgi:hypothetical protein